MPRSALCSLRGKKRELERSRQCESRQAPAASLICRFASVNLSWKKQLGPAFLPKVLLKLLGTEDGAKGGTLDAMSRRKLGSRPQHLSAIQGKPSGAAMCGDFDGCDSLSDSNSQFSSSIQSSHGKDAHRR